MKEKINQILNIVIGSFAGVFIGTGLYECWHFRKYPDLYAMRSAPWYTRILIHGVFTLVFCAICMIVKVILIKNIGLMKKTALILGIIFLALTFIGGGYVLINRGQVNAGYAVVPGIWSMICLAYGRSRKHE